MKKMILKALGVISLFLFVASAQAETFDIAQYFPLINNNSWAFSSGGSSETSYVNGTRTINSVVAMAYHYSDGSEEYYTADSAGFRMHGVYFYDSASGQWIFQPFFVPLVIAPQIGTLGSTYTGSSYYSYYGYSITLTSTLVVSDTTEDITASSGALLKGAIKVTWTMRAQCAALGYDVIQTQQLWLYKDIGVVKQVSGEHLSIIQSAITRYPATGLIKTELKAGVSADGYIYYEYQNDNYQGRGYGRATKKQRLDGSYVLISAYWSSTETPQVVEEYDASSQKLSVKTYQSNGQLSQQYDYYPGSGNLKAYYNEWNGGANFMRYAFMDEDYYGYFIAGDPNHSHGQGRFLKWEYMDDTGNVNFREFEYYGDTLDVKKVTTSDWLNGVIVPNAKQETTFYNESFLSHPRKAIDSAGNTVISTLAISYENGAKAHIIKRGPSGNLIWSKEFTVNNTSALNVAVCVDSSNNVYVASEYYNGTDSDLIVYKYDANGNQVGLPYIFNNGGWESVSYISVDFSGNVIVCGTTDPGTWTNRDLYVVKITPDLTLSWQNIYDSGYNDYDGYITFDHSGNICVHASSSNNPDRTLRSFVVSYAPAGQILSTGHSWLDIYYSGNEYGCWETGRDYKYSLIEDGVIKEERYCFAYMGGTGKAILMNMLFENSMFPAEYGKLTFFTFFNTSTSADTGYYGMFENGTYGEAVPSGSVEGVKVTKACNVPGRSSTYWFLWGEDVYQEYDNVVIEKTSSNQWFAHRFTPNTENFEELLSGWISIGEITDPEKLVLPELGNWWDWCARSGIVPEFPPISTIMNADDTRTDHNPIINTTYSYWDGTGLKQRAVYKEAESDEWVATIEYYGNGTHVQSLQIADPNPAFSGDAVKYEYDIGGRIIGIIYDTGDLETFFYWTEAGPEVRYHVWFGAGDIWQKTIEYYADGATRHYEWILDADSGQSGDVIRYEYDSLGRLALGYHDDTSIITYSYHGSTDNVQYYAAFAPGYDWQETIEYYEDGATQRNKWMMDKNPALAGDDTGYVFDLRGRLTEKRSDDGSFVRYTYCEESGLTVRYYTEYGPGYEWRKTIEYWQDGVTIYQQWWKDANLAVAGDQVFYRHDSSGRLIEIRYDDGGKIQYVYWDESGGSVRYRIEYRSGGEWWRTREFLADGFTLRNEWTQSFTMIGDDYGRPTEVRYGDGSLTTYGYRYATDESWSYRVQYGPGYEWRETQQNLEDGTTYVWRSDYYPSFDGNEVFLWTDSCGRIVEKRLDDGLVMLYDYKDSYSMSVLYYSEYGPGYDWLKTIEYWDGIYDNRGNQVIRYQWLKDNDPGSEWNEIRYIHDDKGRLIEKHYDNTAIVQYSYWEGTAESVRYYVEFDPGYDWQKTIEYWRVEDWEYIPYPIMHYQWLKDQHPEIPEDIIFIEYDATGQWVSMLRDDGRLINNPELNSLQDPLCEEALRMDIESASTTGSASHGFTYAGQMADPPATQDLLPQ